MIRANITKDKAMNTAQRFLAALDACQHDEQDFRILPRGFVAAWRGQAWEVKHPFGLDGSDPYEEWIFEDGSAVGVSNPHQAALPIRAEEIEQEVAA